MTDARAAEMRLTVMKGVTWETVRVQLPLNSRIERSWCQLEDDAA